MATDRYARDPCRRGRFSLATCKACKDKMRPPSGEGGTTKSNNGTICSPSDRMGSIQLLAFLVRPMGGLVTGCVGPLGLSQPTCLCATLGCHSAGPCFL